MTGTVTKSHPLVDAHVPLPGGVATDVVIADVTRRTLWIQNNVTTADDVWVRIDNDAANGIGYRMLPGTGWSFDIAPSQRVSCYCANPASVYVVEGH